MQKANSMYVSKSVKEKFCSLLSLLHQSSEAFKTVALSIADKGMRRTVTGIAVESKQYEQELLSQLKCLGLEELNPPDKFECKELIEHINRVAVQENAEGVIAAWNKSESFLIKAYREVLNEYFPFQSLRKMIAYQLNGIKFEFMKMRLLNELTY